MPGTACHLQARLAPRGLHPSLPTQQPACRGARVRATGEPERGEPKDGARDGQQAQDWSGGKAAPATKGAPKQFSWLENKDSVRDFARLQLQEITDNIEARRDKIFLLMEEVRRLRIQQKLKGGQRSAEEEVGEERYPSVIPFFPPMSDATLDVARRGYVVLVATLILFGGLLAPVLEVRLGLGGTSYTQFIRSLRLPEQLAQVDPIVASFCGGAVGVLTTLILLEANNAKAQAERRCAYCQGSGYVTCGACVGSGAASDGQAGPAPPLAPQGPAPSSSSRPAGAMLAEPNGASSSSRNGGNGTKRLVWSFLQQGPLGPRQPVDKRSFRSLREIQHDSDRCGQCSGTGKVMCIGCLCTGKKVAREHDVRLDPFF